MLLCFLPSLSFYCLQVAGRNPIAQYVDNGDGPSSCTEDQINTIRIAKEDAADLAAAAYFSLSLRDVEKSLSFYLWFGTGKFPSLDI